jgi:hypothetical protein
VIQLSENAIALKAADLWPHPVGTTVTLRRDDGSTFDTRTRSSADLLGGHSWVIWLEGVRGCVLLERVQVRP